MSRTIVLAQLSWSFFPDGDAPVWRESEGRMAEVLAVLPVRVECADADVADRLRVACAHYELPVPEIVVVQDPLCVEVGDRLFLIDQMPSAPTMHLSPVTPFMKTITIE